MTDAAGGRVSIGVPGALGPEAIGEIAHAVEEAGFHALWVNDTPAGDALAGLAGAARTTEHLVLATGVLALDRRSGSDILRDVRAHRLPEERLVLGVGSGPVRAGALDRVRDGVRALSDGTSARIVAGALGPRSCAGPLRRWPDPSIRSTSAPASGRRAA